VRRKADTAVGSGQLADYPSHNRVEPERLPVQSPGNLYTSLPFHIASIESAGIASTSS
jgi:hypothetical protein